MPTLAIKTKLQRTCLPCFVLWLQRLGATPPREVFGVKDFGEEKGSRFFEGEPALIKLYQSHKTLWRDQLQKNDARQLLIFFCAMNFHAAAKASLYFIPLTSMTDELSTTHISVKLQARPRLACGRCGGARRGTRRARTM